MQEADALAALLEDGTEVAEAFQVEWYWPGKRGVAEAESGSPRVSAAWAVLDIAYAICDPAQERGRLNDAMARWRRACVLPGESLQLAEGSRSATDYRPAGPMPGMLAEDPAVGYARLVSQALSGTLPEHSHAVHVAVVFGGPDDGIHGRLTLAVQPAGPRGLYPDPRSMAFLAADPEFAKSLDTAWRSAPDDIKGQCIVWDISDRGRPFREVVEGGSLGAAFGVGLRELCRASRPMGRARVRRLDPHCAVTGRMDADGKMLPVTHYDQKFRAAKSQRWRIVVPGNDPEAVRHAHILNRHAHISKRVAYARDLHAAIRKSRWLRLNPHGIIATIVVLVLAAVGSGTSALAVRSGEMTARNQAAQRLHVVVSNEVVSRSESLDNSDPALARLLSVAAWRINPSDEARYAMVKAAAMPTTVVLTGPTGAVGAVAFSPDGKILADADGGTIRLWDTATGRPIRVLNAHTFEILSVAFSPDGKILADADGGTIRLWDTAAGRPIRVLTGPTVGAVDAVAFSPDGKILAGGSDLSNGKVGLWDAATGRLIRILTGPVGLVDAVAFSPDGKTLASSSDDGVPIGGTDGTVTLWDVATGQPISAFTGHTGTIGSLAFSPDGKAIAVGTTAGLSSPEGTLTLWDAATGQPISAITSLTGGAGAVAFSPDGKTLAISGGDGTIGLEDVATGQVIDTLTGHASQVLSVAFSPDSKTLASGSTDGTVRLWNMAISIPTRAIDTQAAQVFSVAFSPDGKTLASGGNDGTVRLWDTVTGHPVRVLTGHVREVPSVAFSPNGKILAGGGSDGTVRLWDVATGRLIRVLAVHASVQSVVFSRDSETLAIGSFDGKIRLWDTATGGPARVLTDHAGEVVSMAFSPDGRTLAVGSFDGAVRLWDTATGRSIHVFTGQANFSVPVAFSPDGKTLAIGDGDGTVRLWDAATRAPVFVPSPATAGGIDAVAFSPDGRTLASSGGDGTVRLWDVATGHLIRIVTTDSSPGTGVISLAFSPDGKTLATGTVDGIIRLWDVAYTDGPAAYLCAAGQTLSRAEWTQWIPPGPAYQDICP